MSEDSDSVCTHIYKINKSFRERKKDLLKKLDKKVRSFSNYITQVNLMLLEEDRNITITNSEANYIKSNKLWKTKGIKYCC